MKSALEESDGIRAPVLEFVEGPTLADRIKQGPIPLDEALPIAKQIAEALEAAHEAGVIHRDLKPANIKVRDDGTVKVLDFGLAKALDPSPTGDPSQSPTLTAAATQMGMIMGTAAYMSPEQARGKPVDKRADIWAFGCVLYEMLAGKRAFDGEDVSLTLSAVLQREPDFNELPSGVPTKVHQVLRVCLRKDSKQRMGDVRDVRLALEGAFDTTAPPESVRLPMPKPLWRRAAPYVALVLMVGVISGLAGRFMTPAPTIPGDVGRFVHPLPLFDDFRSIDRSMLAVAPDGSSVVFPMDDGLFIRTMDQFEVRLIPGTEGGRLPFFSSDSQWLGFTVVGNRLFKIPVAGGIAIDLGQNGSPYGASWSEDGTILFVASGGIWRISADGGEAERLVEAAEGRQIDGPRLLPGSEWVLYSEGAADDWDAADVVVQALVSGERKVVVRGARDAYYVRTGHLLYVRGTVLYAALFDLDAVSVSGEGLPILDGLARTPIVSASANYGVSDSGLLVYARRGQAERTSTLVWVDREGREEALPAPPGGYDFPRLSPDGLRLVLTARDGVQRDIAVWDLARNLLVPVTRTEVSEIWPTWTPDGLRIAYHIPGVGSLEKMSDGSGQAEIITPNSQWEHAFTASGEQLLVTSVGNRLWTEGVGGIGVASANDAASRWLIVPPPGEVRRNPSLSPGDRWLAYDSDETGTSEIFVRAFPDVEVGLQRVSTAGGMQPLWSRDGRELFYLEPGAPPRLMVVSVTPGDTLDLGQPQSLMAWPYEWDRPWGQRLYDVDPTGRRFLAMKAEAVSADESQRSQLYIVRNWFEELTRLVPTN